MPQIERRSQSRIPRRHSVQFGTDRADHIGFIKNLSLDGMAISAKIIFRPQTELLLLIPQKPVAIEFCGEVRWSSHKRNPGPLETVMEMGLLLTKKGDDYLEFMQQMMETQREVRREPRFEKVFRVAFESPRDLLAEYTQNISQGGMFVLTDTPPALNSTVEVNLLIPDIMRVVHVEGKVVHILTRADAERLGLRPGIGVQFSSFSGDDQVAFNTFIARLKQESGAES